jgi:4-amino-4-deoxy-L-arabinose transferase-like glycosyltransferase
MAGEARETFRQTLRALSPRAAARALVSVIDEDRVTAWIVGAAVLIQLIAAGWDLPSSIGWENDGVAPRDYLQGVVENLKPGGAHRYPLFHALVLTVLCSPVLLVSAVVALSSGTGVNAVVATVPAMTAVSVIIKAVHVAMGGAVVLGVARVARRLFGVAAGRGAALFALTSLTVSYYARVSNLDAPYVFWTVVAVDRLLTVIESGAAREYALLGVFVAFSVATKDQAYAGYVLTLPLFLLVVPLVSRARFAAGSAHFRRVVQAGVAAFVTYAVVGTVVLNPSGFLARLLMLTGTNSQDWRNYERGSRGLFLNLHDLWVSQASFFWHWTLVAFAWSGILVAALIRPGPALHGRWVRLVPAVAAISSVAFFTLPVARCEHRFVLPLTVWLSVYGGAALGWLLDRGKLAWPVLAVAAVGLLLSAFRSLTVIATEYGDARPDVEKWLAELPQGSTVETYGIIVFQPRFDLSGKAPYRVSRVDRQPAKGRAMYAGVTEVQGALTEAASRGADVLVVNEGWAAFFLPRTFRPGEAPSVQWIAHHDDRDSVRFFENASRGVVPGYRLVREFRPELPAWMRALGAEPIVVHDWTTGERVWVFERDTVTQ